MGFGDLIGAAVTLKVLDSSLGEYNKKANRELERRKLKARMAKQQAQGPKLLTQAAQSKKAKKKKQAYWDLRGKQFSGQKYLNSIGNPYNQSYF